MENKHRSQAACKSISPWSCWWSAGTGRGIVRGSSGCALHGQTVSLPSFFIIIKKFWSILINIQYWSFSIIIKRFFINTDLRWHHLSTTRSLCPIQSHGRCEEPHTELMMTFMIFFLLWNFHHDFYDNFPSSWSSSTCISWRGKNMFYLGNVFVPRRRVLICWLPGLESHLAGFYPSDHSPHEDDHDDPMIIISSNLFVLPLWSSSAWRWSWGPCFWDDNCDDGCNITMITEMKTSWKRLLYVIFLLYLCRFVHLEGWILCFLLEMQYFKFSRLDPSLFPYRRIAKVWNKLRRKEKWNMFTQWKPSL